VMNKLILVLSLISLLTSISLATENSAPSKEQKEVASSIGIILPGMTKEEVRQTFGLLRPFEGFTVEGQEAWRYSAPEKQVIFFNKQGKVERVRLFKKDRVVSQNEKII